MKHKRKTKTKKNKKSRRSRRYLRGGNKEDIVIYQPWGGLGDNLQFSTLPELYKKAGHKVYISSKNAYRNNEIYDLVWKMNPYVDGISDLPENAGSVKGVDGPYEHFIKNVEHSHGFTDGYRDYPVIYYKPKKVEGVDNFIFYDTTSVSSNPSDQQIAKSFQSIFSKYPDLVPRRIEFSNIKNRAVEGLSHEPYILYSIYEYCDLLNSCKAFICGDSGSAVLASTIKQDNSTPEIYSFSGRDISNFFIYKFKNVKYSNWI
jgi:hypothetical protein